MRNTTVNDFTPGFSTFEEDPVKLLCSHHPPNSLGSIRLSFPFSLVNQLFQVLFSGWGSSYFFFNSGTKFLPVGFPKIFASLNSRGDVNAKFLKAHLGLLDLVLEGYLTCGVADD